MIDKLTIYGNISHTKRLISLRKALFISSKVLVKIYIAVVAKVADLNNILIKGYTTTAFEALALTMAF